MFTDITFRIHIQIQQMRTGIREQLKALAYIMYTYHTSNNLETVIKYTTY